VSWLIISALCFFLGTRLGGSAADERSDQSAPAQEDRAEALSSSQSSAAHLALPEPSGESSEEPRRFGSEVAPLSRMSPAELSALCPPCDCPCAKPKKPKPRRGRRKPLPAPKMSPLERAQLLSWVKRHSERLKRCRDTGQPIYRLHAKLKLKTDASGVHSVSLKGDEVPSAAISCIQRDMLKWPPPAGLKPSKHPLLVFSLQLD